MVVRYSERQSIELHVTKVAARRDRIDVLSALLDRVAVGTVRRQAGLSNQCPNVRFVRKNGKRFRCRAGGH